MNRQLIEFIRDEYRTNDPVPLHSPSFRGNERQYILDCIDTTFVSSVGKYVDRFEKAIADYTGSKGCTATVTGTSALHIALKLSGVQPDDLVITQSVTFVATCNAINYCGAEPIFLDVSANTLGLSPNALRTWLDTYAEIDDQGRCIRKRDRRVIRACLPMHTFGHPCEITEILKITNEWQIALIEDAAESLGSLYQKRHTGTFGKAAAISFNGNKIITTGGGGAILSDSALAARAKHVTTTAKKAHPYEYVHDEIGFNYRLPNLNAALGCAQLELLESFIVNKRKLAARYKSFFTNADLTFFSEPPNCRSNYWLNAVLCNDSEHQRELIKETNEHGIMTRPIWLPMHLTPMYRHCERGDLTVTEWLKDRVVNLPSSVVRKSIK